jgi:hypothetical protein
VCVLFGTTTRPPWHFTSLPPNSEPLLPVAYSVRDVVVTYQACCGVVCPRAGRGRCGFTERKSETLLHEHPCLYSAREGVAAAAGQLCNRLARAAACPTLASLCSRFTRIAVLAASASIIQMITEVSSSLREASYNTG